METTSADIGPELAKMATELRGFTSEVKTEVDKLGKQSAEASARLLAIEQLVASPGRGGRPGGASGGASIGQTVVEAEGFKSLQLGGRSSGRIAVKSFESKATVVTGSWSAAPDYVPQMFYPPQRILTVRNLLPNLATASNLIEFPRELVNTNASDYQGAEGSQKPESAITYELASAPVVTIATWIPCSKQVLDDSTSLSGYIDSRLIYMVSLKVERELLYGDGASQHLNGLMTQAPTMTGGAAPDLVSGVASAISQLSGADVVPDSLVCNPVNWWSMQVQKAAGAGSFLVGDPLSQLPPVLWGLRVALSNSINPGSFLVGNFRNGAAVYDRQAAVVELSREHSDYFTKNLVAILAELRLALAVYTPGSFLKGSTGVGS
jgi:HK97 family phage major capsid protein